MNTQRALALAGKEIKRITREPANLFIALVFPLILTLAFGASFGAVGGGESRYTIAYVSLDQSPYSSALRGALAQVPVLDVKDYTDAAQANQDLSQGRISAVLVVPASFGDSVTSYKADPGDAKAWRNSTLSLSVDKGSIVVSAAIPPVIVSVVSTLVAGKQAVMAIPVVISQPTLVEAQKISQFSLMAPGMFAYAAIFIIMLVAQSIVTEREKGILTRISVTPTTTGDILMSHIVSNLLVGGFQTMVIYAASTLMGFNPLGGPWGIVVALVAVMLLTLCSVGFGLITATFARSSGVATGISFVFILPLMFLGTFVPVPASVSRLVPSWYLTDALTSIFIRGASVASPAIISDIVTLAFSSVAVIAAGILLYSRLGNR